MGPRAGVREPPVTWLCMGPQGRQDLSTAPQRTRLLPQLQTTCPTDTRRRPPSSTVPAQRPPESPPLQASSGQLRHSPYHSWDTDCSESR